MKVIVAGGRDFENYNLLKEKLSYYFKNRIKEEITIISGDARGADTLGCRYAKEYGLKLEHYPANWKTYGKLAGHIRNKQMADNATHLVAFWDGKSKGTKDMINIATEQNLPIRIVRY